MYVCMYVYALKHEWARINSHACAKYNVFASFQKEFGALYIPICMHACICACKDIYTHTYTHETHIHHETPIHLHLFRGHLQGRRRALQSYVYMNVYSYIFRL
jgi:hypothetical protein